MLQRNALKPVQRYLSSAPAAGRIGVVGLGLMGHGIAQVAAEKGFEVCAVELEDRFLQSGMTRIEGSVSKLAAKAVSKGKLDAAQADQHVAATLGRIAPTTDVSALAGCSLVIEAVIEDMTLKKRLYTQLGGIVGDDCIIASNTSSLSIAKMAPFTGRDKQMVGLREPSPYTCVHVARVLVPPANACVNR